MAAAPIFAIVSPFRKDGALDPVALKDYVSFLEAHGVQRIIAGGTTGEFASMTLPERKRLLELCRASFRGEIIAHVSACNAPDAAELLHHATDNADAALLMPPFYYREPPAEGVAAFLKHVLWQSSLPAYLYNFPRHVQFGITPELLAEVSREVPHLRGIKESGGWPGLAMEFKQACPSLEVYVGSDNAALAILEHGLDGTVTGGSNAVPKLLVELVKAWNGGNAELASQYQTRLTQWGDARRLSGLDEIPTTKAVLAAMLPGFPLHVRPPLVPATEPDVKLADLAKGLMNGG